MKLFLLRYKFQMLIVLIFVFAEVIVNPIGEFPLGDDWSYTKTLKILLRDGKIYIGHWCAMSLVSHIFWGYLFVKIFGFSFTILRLANLLSALIGALVLNQICYKAGKNKYLAFVAALCLLFNPLFFNISNSFMTDTNFITWLLISVYFAFIFFEKKKILPLFLFMFMSLTLVLCRQFGIIVPFCFLIVCLFLPDKPMYYFLLALAGFVLVVGVFKYYEAYLASVLPDYANYQFSKKVLYNADFFTHIWNNIINRFKQYITAILFYLAPFCLFFIGSIIRFLNWKQILMLLLIDLYVVLFWIGDINFMIGNIFTSMALGPDTFYESAMSTTKLQHAHSAIFEQAMVYVQFIFVMISFFVCSAAILSSIINRRDLRKPPINILFIIILSLSYFSILFVSESSFDRYIVPLLAPLSILLATQKQSVLKFRLYMWLPLLFFMYVAVFGTKDFITINRVKWQAVNFLQKEKNIPINKINAGFEPCNWYDGATWSWWVNYTTLDDFDYVVQYRQEPGFRLYKTYCFRKYFPNERDTINVFVRDGIH